MPELAITPLAREDVKEIGRYTQRTWGVAQRDVYLRGFAALFERLRTGAIVGRLRSEVRDGLLCYPYNRHLVFFRRDRHGDVVILRVLHERMDFERHL
ncbi:type II toxin-antitoxin system RelE/ParE family toxin [Ensifer sp. ENS11]|uniref:type II toxin-antitoxin system RelE/ParE family toxin n=1 Tax=Ensifer sp. ENS11 TaxID=2769291 RepID=UPI0017818D2D|nr:type II toxin-antitoxin system RelE/ParE family toxin [Ensifer sp. ENS11]MBD9491193.1 type II toxin-antitoxin system RelE/ParE family toxin [Ensifer sp. ENS11]